MQPEVVISSPHYSYFSACVSVVESLCGSRDISNCVNVVLHGDDPADSQAVMEALLDHDLDIEEWCR